MSDGDVENPLKRDVTMVVVGFFVLLILAFIAWVIWTLVQDVLAAPMFFAKATGALTAVTAASYLIGRLLFTRGPLTYEE